MDWRTIENDAQPHILKFVYKIADAMISYMEDEGVIPVDTHNLKDSTGLGVYSNSALVHYYQKVEAEVPRDGIWGYQRIQQVIDLGASKYTSGVTIVLFSSMPYAKFQDTRGQNAGYFTELLVPDFKEFTEEIIRRYANNRD